MAKAVFFSFYYDNDVHRVQLVRNINALEGQPELTAQAWEEVKAKGPKAIQVWIDEKMKGKSAVIVLIGEETASRPWVKYEILRAWELKKPLLGVRIHGLSSLGKVGAKGQDPFTAAGLTGIPVFDPTVHTVAGPIDTKATYAAVVANLPGWAERGVIKPE
ncbi:TIR domain-containing protein [Clavibacter sp. CFBP 8614]|uniref:TIR domain-containing protein n=1 Tax=unclassified Clavibacter TaxID=2626594 RepID=UPI004042BD94